VTGTIKRMLVTLLCLTAAASAIGLTSTTTSAPPPAFVYDSILNTYFDDESGLIRISNIDLAFAPEGEINAAVAVVNSDNTVVKSYKFYAEPRWRIGVFAHLSEVGPADITLTEPGVYNIVFLIDGKPVTRLPVVLEQTSEGDDPFDPKKTYRFFGFWQLYGYLTMSEWKDKPVPELNLWLGGKDLPEGKDKDTYTATLKRDGEAVAHSKRTQGHFKDGHYERAKIKLYHPHTERESPNAMPFMLSDWTETDGDYKLDITRKSDGKLIRSFTVTVKDEKIENLPATKLDFEPHIDYIVPRVLDRGAGQYGFLEAIWLISE
jgi:hypothetical protein